MILLANPFAAAGVSLQLSFAATLGLVCFSQRLSGFFKGLYRGKKRPVRAVVSFVAANLSASLAAMVFTIPLTACYFNTFSLIAPLSNRSSFRRRDGASCWPSWRRWRAFSGFRRRGCWVGACGRWCGMSCGWRRL